MIDWNGEWQPDRSVGRPDSLNEARGQAETGAFKEARMSAVRDNVGRFVGQIRATIAAHQTGKSMQIAFNAGAFESELEQSRSTLDSFCRGEMDIDSANRILQPIVTESIGGLGLKHHLIVTREALMAIAPIKV